MQIRNIHIAMASSAAAQRTAYALAVVCMLATVFLLPATAAPAPVNVIWTNGMPYSPVILTAGQNLVLSWPGAVRSVPPTRWLPGSAAYKRWIVVPLRSACFL